MIISASRRTDIPAFYSKWFLNRIRDQFVLIRNPFNYHQITRVELTSDEVDCIVFWTRNPLPLIPHLQELDSRGLRYYFQFTITGYGPDLEPHVPSLASAVSAFKKLSDLVGPERVIWRYDPIAISKRTPSDFHVKTYTAIAEALRGYTHGSVISILDVYKKTEKNMANIFGFDVTDQPSEECVFQIATTLGSVATSCAMDIKSCAEKYDLSHCGIPSGKCIDEALLTQLWGISYPSKKDAGQRLECGCVKSIDIGMYNTCGHGCKYCYATFSHKTAQTNIANHDPASPFLLGGIDGIDPSLLIKKRQNALQPRLF